MADSQPPVLTIVASEEVPHAREEMIAFQLTVRINDGEPFRLSTTPGIPIRVMHFKGRLGIAQIRQLLAVGAQICAPITHLDPGSQRAEGYRRSDRAVDPTRIESIGQRIATTRPSPVQLTHVPGTIEFNDGGKMGSRAV